jgi:hypothetical protein
MPNFSVGAVVVCDDARRELAGKDILIGVYGGGILVPSFPVSITLCVWMELIPEQSGQLQVEISIKLPGR